MGSDGNPVVPDRTVLVAEPRDELVCRALGAVLNQKLPSSSSNYFQEEDNSQISFWSRVLDWNNRLGPLAKIDIIDIHHIHMSADHLTLLERLEPHLHPEVLD